MLIGAFKNSSFNGFQADGVYDFTEADVAKAFATFERRLEQSAGEESFNS